LRWLFVVQWHVRCFDFDVSAACCSEGADRGFEVVGGGREALRVTLVDFVVVAGAAVAADGQDGVRQACTAQVEVSGANPVEAEFVLSALACGG
jgi:hypothetical protein